MNITDLPTQTESKPFDGQPLPELNSEVVDFTAASECFEPVRKLKRANLATLRLLVSHQGRMVPSVGDCRFRRIARPLGQAG